MNPKPIRILQVIDNMDLGGMENMLINYYKKIDKNKFQFDFLLSNKSSCAHEEEIIKNGGKIFRITPRRINPIINRIEIERFFKQNKYDIIEIHQGVTYLLPLKMANKYKIRRIIIHNHGIDQKYKHGLYDIYRKKIIIPYIKKRATNFFACSEKVLGDLFDEKIIKNKNYYIINNVIDVEKYKQNNKTRNDIRRELGIRDNTCVVGHVGNFTYPKNQKFIIDISRQLKNYTFILVGDGKYYQQLKELAPKNVLFYGKTNEADIIMQSFDVFIMPSLWEGVPLAAIEAQAIGIKTLLSDKISTETIISKSTKRIQLNIDGWIKEIKRVHIGEREANSSLITKAGYNNAKEASKIEKIYKIISNQES